MYAAVHLTAAWLRPPVKAHSDPQTILVFYRIFVASARTGPWTWTEPSADGKRSGLQRAWRWRASARRARTSPFNPPRAAAGRYPSLLCLHNPTSKRWRRSRFLAISLFKGMLGRKRNLKKKKQTHRLGRWEWRKVISQFPGSWKTFCHSLLVRNLSLWIKSLLVHSSLSSQGVMWKHYSCTQWEQPCTDMRAGKTWLPTKSNILIWNQQVHQKLLNNIFLLKSVIIVSTLRSMLLAAKPVCPF